MRSSQASSARNGWSTRGAFADTELIELIGLFITRSAITAFCSLVGASTAPLLLKLLLIARKFRKKKARMTTAIPWFVVQATAVASLGGILFGYDLGVISGALEQLTDAFNLTSQQAEWVVGILYLGGGLGAAVGGLITDSLGRKTGIIICDVIFMVGALILYWAQDIWHLYVGRVVMGFGISVSGIADVAYLHELAPINWRGSIVSVNEACISLGFMIAFLVGYLLRDEKDGWRDMFGLSGYLAMLQLLLMWAVMPESPVWLKQKGRDEEGLKVLLKIYGNSPEMESVIDAVAGEESDNPTETPTVSVTLDQSIPSGASDVSVACKRSTSRDKLGQDVGTNYSTLTHEESATRLTDETSTNLWNEISRFGKQAYIALFLAIAQQLSGQTPVLSYAPMIFAAVREEHDERATLYIGFFKFLVTVVVIWRIEYIGRRVLLLAGMGTIVLGQGLISLAYRLGVSLQASDDDTTTVNGMMLAMLGTLLVVTGYSASFGPLTWLLTSELFPPTIRGRALGVSTIVTYLFAALTTSTFLSMQSAMGSAAVFALYGGVTFLGTTYAYLAIPDTGGKSVEEIDSSLGNTWWWRRRRQRVSLYDREQGVRETRDQFRQRRYHQGLLS